NSTANEHSLIASRSLSEFLPAPVPTVSLPAPKVSPSLSVSIPHNHNVTSIRCESASDQQALSAMDIDDSDNLFSPGYGDEPESPDGNDDANNKRRHRLRPEQTRRLMEVFQKTSKPDSDSRKILGKQLGMTPRTVQIWFQNRRAKIKRESNAANALRMPGHYATGNFANRGRLTYNRTPLNRRINGRVASEGFEHLRNSRGFDPYMTQEPSRGLPLQNPSQVSIPMDTPMHFPSQAMRSEYPTVIPGQPFYGHGAMGVPAHGSAPSSFSSRNANVSPPNMVNMAGNVAQLDMRGNMGIHVSNHAFVNNPHNSVTGTHYMPQNGAGPLPVQFPHPQGGSDFWPGNVDGFSANGGMSSGNTPLVSKQALSNLSPISPADIPSAEALLESRRRHLQDLMIINQTHAARNMCTNSMPGSSVGVASNSSETGDVLCEPLLFSEISRPSAQCAVSLATPSVSPDGNVSSSSCNAFATTVSDLPAPPLYSSDSSAQILQGLIDNNGSADSAVRDVTQTEADAASCFSPKQAADSTADSENNAQYQILKDLLLHYDTLENKLDNIGDKQSDAFNFSASYLSDALLSTTESVASTAAATSAAKGGSDRITNSAPVIAVHGFEGIDMINTACLSAEACNSDKFTFDKAAFLLASVSPSTLSKSRSCEAIRQTPASFHAPISDVDSNQLKQTTTPNHVSVVPAALAGQREYTIEQMSYSSMQF
ncbi:hypothetical protein LPJ73_002030, partial [Coemansia sp. RSA 2703]